MLFPLGLLMGMLFPSGIARVSQCGKARLIPWLWAANGFCSVLGATLAGLLAMLIGFSQPAAAGRDVVSVGLAGDPAAAGGRRVISLRVGVPPSGGL